MDVEKIVRQSSHNEDTCQFMFLVGCQDCYVTVMSEGLLEAGLAASSHAAFSANVLPLIVLTAWCFVRLLLVSMSGRQSVRRHRIAVLRHLVGTEDFALLCQYINLCCLVGRAPG